MKNPNEINVIDAEVVNGNDVKESKEYIRASFFNKIAIPLSVLDNSFKESQEKILKWIPDNK